MPKPTPAQRRVLEAMAVGWYLVNHRLALTWTVKHRGVNSRVAEALITAGWAEKTPEQSPTTQTWRITPAGRAALEGKGK